MTLENNNEYQVIVEQGSSAVQGRDIFTYHKDQGYLLAKTGNSTLSSYRK